jgi:hypothetical protein
VEIFYPPVENSVENFASDFDCEFKNSGDFYRYHKACGKPLKLLMKKK